VAALIVNAGQGEPVPAGEAARPRTSDGQRKRARRTPRHAGCQNGGRCAAAAGGDRIGPRHVARGPTHSIFTPAAAPHGTRNRRRPTRVVGGAGPGVDRDAPALAIRQPGRRLTAARRARRLVWDPRHHEAVFNPLPPAATACAPAVANFFTRVRARFCSGIDRRGNFLRRCEPRQWLGQRP
jgi:hypothetical protein